MANLPYPETPNGDISNAPMMDDKKKASGGLFSSKPKIPGVDMNTQMSSLSNIINDLGRRVRIVEEKINTIDKKIKLIEENSLSSFKKVNSLVSTFHDDINDFRKHIKTDDEKTELIIKELKLSAKRDDVAVLQRYIELWDPVKFATHNEIDRIIEEKVEERINSLLNAANSASPIKNQKV